MISGAKKMFFCRIDESFFYLTARISFLLQEIFSHCKKKIIVPRKKMR